MKKDDNQSQGMTYLDSLPRRVVTVYVPLCIFIFVLLFPFYWMAITAFKPDAELLSRSGNPFWVVHPTLAHFKKLIFDTPYPDWMLNTVIVSVVEGQLYLELNGTTLSTVVHAHQLG